MSSLCRYCGNGGVGDEDVLHEKCASLYWEQKMKTAKPEPQKSEASELRQQITKCFRDTYMQTEGETELFDTEETIDALELLIRQREAEAYKKGQKDERSAMKSYLMGISEKP